MSIKIMQRVFEHSSSKGCCRLVLLCLADYADESGTCWPAVATLARKAGMTDRSVRKYLRELESIGELRTVVAAGTSGTNRYVVAIDDTPGTRLPGGTPFPGPPEHPFRPPRKVTSITPEHPFRQTVKNRHLTVNEPSKSRTRTKTRRRKLQFEVLPDDWRSDALAELPGCDPEALFAAFKDYHAAKGNQFADWKAAFRTWVRNETKFSRGRNEPNHSAGRKARNSADNLQAMFAGIAGAIAPGQPVDSVGEAPDPPRGHAED